MKCHFVTTSFYIITAVFDEHTRRCLFFATRYRNSKNFSKRSYVINLICERFNYQEFP